MKDRRPLGFLHESRAWLWPGSSQMLAGLPAASPSGWGQSPGRGLARGDRRVGPCVLRLQFQMALREASQLRSGQSCSGFQIWHVSNKTTADAVSPHSASGATKHPGTQASDPACVILGSTLHCMHGIQDLLPVHLTLPSRWGWSCPLSSEVYPLHAPRRRMSCVKY